MNNQEDHENKTDELVNLLVTEERKEILKEIAAKLPEIVLNDRHIYDLELLASGCFSPLEGFMTRADYESVIDRMRLQSGSLWPLPICLDIPEIKAKTLESGQSVALRDPEGYLLAIMHIEEMWKVEPAKEAQKVYGTTDRNHPGVNYLFSIEGSYYVGGKIEVSSMPIHFDFKQIRMNPSEVKTIYKKLGWQRVVGFMTRNPIHRPQFEITLKAMRDAKANLLILPIVGVTKPGDFDHYTRGRCYKEVIKYYPPDSYILNLLPLATRMGGYKEAILHSIIAKNFGCTHFIVGRDHAGIGFNKKEKISYGEGTSNNIDEAYSNEIGLKIMQFEELVYVPFNDEFQFISQVPKDTKTISLSGSDIRERIRFGKKVPEWASFPEVIAELKKSYPPPRKQGLTVFLTGLSGAGKSTIAKILYSRFLEIGDRPVTLLDGDIVRRNLSNLLTFSKEHRDINVRRIGFVASEITKNRGIAICAPIAPYNSTRSEIREIIESYGGFVEVHVATPLNICEKRDRKGMYAKARAGLIKGFTGVDDPYEIPEFPEVSIDTTNLTPDEAAHEILLYLGQKGYI
ncbi:MAG: bifunctional sulfate adenylyltransferase/adenylylsulfate kinase [Desulfobacterales bacterium]|nr:bifunctional sulfate adenylyltransferase/adenylylsulfate kinase [Desulfobacterales bacterium]